MDSELKGEVTESEVAWFGWVLETTTSTAENVRRHVLEPRITTTARCEQEKNQVTKGGELEEARSRASRWPPQSS